MNKKKNTGDPAAPDLTEEDAELWRKITTSTKPLHEKNRNRITPAVTEEEIARAPQKTFKKTNKRKQTEPGKEQVKAVRPSPQKKQPPPLSDIDRKKVRKIVTDQINIDATLDLHGFRQEQALAALRSFIRTGQAQNHQYVLVITGKGAPKTFSEGSSWLDFEPGVLRRAVPLWLSDPDMREYVVGFTTAQPRHGGDGALYVQLRRKKLKS